MTSSSLGSRVEIQVDSPLYQPPTTTLCPSLPPFLPLYLSFSVSLCLSLVFALSIPAASLHLSLYLSPPLYMYTRTFLVNVNERSKKKRKKKKRKEKGEPICCLSRAFRGSFILYDTLCNVIIDTGIFLPSFFLLHLSNGLIIAELISELQRGKVIILSRRGFLSQRVPFLNVVTGSRMASVLVEV